VYAHPGRGRQRVARRRGPEYTPPCWRLAIPDPSETFDPAFLSELEGLVADSGVAVSSAAQGAAGARGYRETLAAFLAPVSAGEPPLDEEGFLSLPAAALAERCNGLIEAGRRSPHHDAAQAVESFIVFFQALVPTLGESAAREVKATFFRLIPTLVPMAWDDVARPGAAGDALRLLETILLEVSSVRLTPAESEILFKSLDQLATLIGAGEYALARDVVALPLLGILRKNRVKRSLFRLMEVEVDIQRYVQQRLGHESPQVKVPEDLAALADYGPVRAFEERDAKGRRVSYLQVQLPDIPILSDIVVRFTREDDAEPRDVRLDALGSGRLDLPPGLYRFGLLYAPEGPRGA
jgi:hypothetical protein